MPVNNLRLLHLFNSRNVIPAVYHADLIKHILKIKQYNNLRNLEIMKYINKKTLKFDNEPITKNKE